MAKTDLPDQYSLSQLYTNLVEPGIDSVSQTLGVLEQCLLPLDGTDRGLRDSQDSLKLFSWVAIAIKPLGDILVQDKPDQVKDLASVSSTAFNCIRYLQTHISLQEHVNPDALLSIIAYTDIEDPWTLESTQRAADQVLNYHQKQLKSHEFVIEHTLIGFVRPLFSDSQTTSVTSRGRKAISKTVQQPHNVHDLNESKKEWKFKEVSAMTVLRWTIRNMDVKNLTPNKANQEYADESFQESMFQKNWHLCIPPLLTLLDDPCTVIRVRGLHILSDLLIRMPSKLLQQTGLGEVFEDAVMPTLLFLPELTPVEDSVNLLKFAYLALLSLGEVMYSSKEELSKKMKFLDRVMRQGLLQGFIHSGDNVMIAELLITEVIDLFNSMGIHAVKYLKDVIPMLSKILMDPFGLSHPSLLLAAAKATQSTVTNCWPRMTESNHRIELIKALTLCWTKVNKEIKSNGERNNSELEAIKHELHLAGNVLVRAVSEKLDMTEELQPLLNVDPSLGSLFGVDATPNQMPI